MFERKFHDLKVTSFVKAVIEKHTIPRKATQIVDYEKLKIEFLSSAEPHLQQKAKLSDHDANLALLEFELTQRRKMNSILKQKQVSNQEMC